MSVSRCRLRAKSVGLPVNVMDDLVHSTFIFPAIVDRGDVVVAIGTGGTSPVVARRVREKIEAVLPARIGDLAKFIGRFRKSIHARIPETPLRRRFWERRDRRPDRRAGALRSQGRCGGGAEPQLPIRPPLPAPRRRARQEAMSRWSAPVPAIPTCSPSRRCARCRMPTSSSTTSWSRLKSSTASAATPRALPVGRRVGKPGIGQEAINQLMIAAARAGQRVVRLKGGDAFVFGRGGEEIDALRKAGISYSVVPGITAAVGAAAQFEVPLTFRRKALRITFLTAHKANDADMIDWSALTDKQMTVVVYMGMTAAPVGARRPARRRTCGRNAGRRVRARDPAGCQGGRRHARAIARPRRQRSTAVPPSSSSATSSRIPRLWRRQNLTSLISDLLEAAQ